LTPGPWYRMALVPASDNQCDLTEDFDEREETIGNVHKRP